MKIVFTMAIEVSVETTSPFAQPSLYFTIRLTNFRRISYLETRIPASGLILLDGPTGIGKTALLEAIAFVLYDNAGHSCYNRKDRGSKKHDPTWVELTFPSSGWHGIPPGLTIQRQRRPNLLRVVGDGILLEDGRTPGAAQGYLDRLLGPYVVWQIGGYIRQDCPCDFFTMSPAEKFGLLQQLSLPDRVDPQTGRIVSGTEQFESYLSRTVDKITEMTSRVHEAEMQTRICAEVYMRHYHQWLGELQSRVAWTPEIRESYFRQYDESCTNASLVEDLGRLTTKVRSTRQQRIKQLEAELAQEQMRLLRLQEIIKQRRRLESELADLPATQEPRLALEREQLQLSMAQQLQLQLAQEQLRIDRLREADQQRGRLEEARAKLQSQLPEILGNSAELERELTELTEQIALSQKTERRSRLLMAKAEIQRRLQALPEGTTNYSSGQLDAFEQLLAGPSAGELRSQIEYQTQLQLYHQRKDLTGRIDRLREQLSGYPDRSMGDEIDALGKRIWSLSLQEKKLVCPRCSADLYLNDHQLTELEHVQEESIELLSRRKGQLQQQESLFQRRGHLDHELKRLESQLASFDSVHRLDGFVPSSNDRSEPLDMLQRKLELRQAVPEISIPEERVKLQAAQDRARLQHDLEQISREIDAGPSIETPIEIAPLEARRSELRAQLELLRQQETKQLQIQAQIHQIQLQLQSIPTDRPDESQLNRIQAELDGLQLDPDPTTLESRQRDLKARLLLLQQQELKRNTLQAQLDQLEPTPDSPDETELKRLQETLAQTTTQFETLETDIGHQIKFAQLSHLMLQHTRAQEQHQQLHQRLAALQRIKASLITAEYLLLDSFLGQINQQLAGVMEQLFVQPASFALRSMKQLKTDDRIKPQINYEIMIDGVDSTSINEVSGGERSRISLAMAIVFSGFSNVPFLLLDESLSTLNASIKETTMKVIRQHLSDKLVIAVNHDTTTGVYDSVVRLE